MSDAKPEFSEEFAWKGVLHRLDFHSIEIIPDGIEISQVQAVPVSDLGEVVLYKHIDGYWGLPGGHVETGERPIDALSRELSEEAALKLRDAHPIFLLVDTNLETLEVSYQVRYLALVQETGERVSDPDGKAILARAFALEEAVSALDWGRRGDLLIGRARKCFDHLAAGSN